MSLAGRNSTVLAVALVVAAGRTHAWDSGTTAFSDRLDAAQAALLSAVVDAGEAPPLAPEALDRLRAAADSLPARWDWRDHDGVTPVKDQGTCGACWAFATAAVLESSALIREGRTYDLAEQEILDCSGGLTGCGGGSFSAAYDVYRSLGAAGESCLPYDGNVAPACGAPACETLVNAGEPVEIPEEIALLKAALIAYGPLYSVMHAPDDFLGYVGGCYSKPGETKPWNHSVAIIGWDDAECGGAWICKNSWGTRWGEEGFFRIRYGQCAVGVAARAVIAEPGPVLLVSSEPLANTMRAGAPFPIEASVALPGGGAAAISGARLHVRVDETDWSVTDMDPAGTGLLRGEIPAPSRPCRIDYYLEAWDGEGRRGFSPPDAPAALHRFDVALFADSFEADSTDWIAGDPADDATAGTWVHAVPEGSHAQPSADCSGSGGMRCWMTGIHATGDPAETDDVDGGTTTLVSPAYDLRDASGARLSYMRWFTTDKGWAGGADHWTAEANNDGGPWKSIESERESHRGWLRVERTLAAALGEAPGIVRFRFRVEDGGEPSVVEAALDDFAILAAAKGPGGAGDAGALRIDATSPNPSRGTVLLTVNLPAPGDLRLRILGVDGRIHREETLAGVASGSRVLVFDGADDSGRPLASGAYVAVIEAHGRRASRGFILLR